MNSYRLDSVCDFINGGAWSDTEYAHSGIHVVKVTNLSDGRVTRGDDNYLPFSKYEEYKQHELISGDIVVSTVGSHPTQPGSVVGRVALVSAEFSGSFLNQNAACIRVNKPNLVSQRYLFYLANTVIFKHHIESRARGSANQVRMAIGELKKFEVQYPSITEQKKIAAILSAYDELIENNQRRIALLEKMAEEIYREWFVRLRFPGHENVKNVKGIPEGWEIDRVDSIGKIVTGKTPSTNNPRYFGGPYFFIKTPDMHGNIFIVETEERLSQNGLDSQPSQTIPRGSICVSCIGTGGIVSITTSECQTNQQINSVIVRNPSDLEWAFFSLRNLREAIQMFGATGATMTNLSKGKFSSLKILRPNKSIVLKYHALVNPIFAQMQSILQQTMILRSTRDLLLPRLISGKLSVEQLDIRFPPGMEESAHAD